LASIVVISHADDAFVRRNLLLQRLFPHWHAAGHRIMVAAGVDALPAADVAILHVDLSVVPPAYVEATRRYPVVVNGSAGDIRKRSISRHLVLRGDGWEGPVIVKTDLNHGGLPERHLAQRREKRGAPVDPALRGTVIAGPYPVYSDAHHVPAAVWGDPSLIVERFLPERDPRGYWMRAWVFFGDRDRCTRYLGAHPVVKAGDILAREPAEVPDELRAERARLGLDYGKLDFVVHDGRTVLLDVNRTPAGVPPKMAAALLASDAELARGLDALLGARR
jgi:hypothetical protein